MNASLEDPSYLLSSILTVAESPSASIHDLLDAYAAFSSRLRSRCQLLEAGDTLLPALAPLKTCKNDFIRALRRDLGLAHVDPLSTFAHSLTDASSIEGDAKQYARDSSSLCHHALCVVATIFRFPAFHLVFPDHDLSILLGDVLDIVLAHQLPVLNAPKTYSLSLWTMVSHRLPTTVLDFWQDRVSFALQRSLDGAIHPCNIVLDGLKAISHTMEYHPSGILGSFSSLLPYVIRNLHGGSPELRLEASIVLGKFANALILQTELSLTKWQTISNHITSFLESYCNEQAASGETTFLRMVRAAFSAEVPTCPRSAPTWIFGVLASLIVLCGPTLYTKPMVLRFILQALAMALTHKRSVIRALHPHVWRCFVWSFSRMLLSAEAVDPTLISSAFYVIKQEVSGGIGVALANVLLSDRMSPIGLDRVSQALSVIKAMVRTDCNHTRQEGFMLLQVLANKSREHQLSQGMYEFPASVLFNGAIIGSKWSDLPSTIRSIPKVPVSVHWLEETEIARHYKTLLEIWKHFAFKVDRKKSAVSQLAAYLVRILNAPFFKSALVDVWLAILLACSQQLECEQRDSATTEMLRYTASVIVEFLPSVVLGDWEPDWGSWDVHDQIDSLTFIDQLWSAVRKAFVAISLADAAALILASILKLCANLMTTASSSFLCNMHEPIASQLVIRSRRELWGVIATSLSSSERSLDWKELAKFLAMPICTWALSEPELEAWEGLLRNVITLSGDSILVTEHFILQYFQGKGVETWESIIAVLGLLLTYAHEHGSCPASDLLSIVDVCLTASYSRAHHSLEALTHSLGLLSVIRYVIASTPGKVMHILRALCHSLCLWIEDHNEVMSDDEFNSVAVSLYCETLEVLKVYPLSIEFLQDTEDFLASAFSRIPTPAIAPFAFEKFWRATYHGRTEFHDHLPIKVKSCLASFVAAYGGDLTDSLSLATESQSQSISNFPAGYQSQHFGAFSLEASPLPTSANVEARVSVSDMEVSMYSQQEGFTGQDDTTFLLPSPDDDTVQPTVLRPLREYSSRVDMSSFDGLGRSTSNPRLLLSPILPSRGAMSSSHSPKKGDLIASYVSNPKRKLADSGDAPQKRSRTSRGMLYAMRKLESEPASRDATPVDIPRTSSVPLKKRAVFDGVQVPTFREVLRGERVREVDTPRNTLSTRRCLVSGSKTPSVHNTRRESRTPSPSVLPSPVESDDDLDWENMHVDVTPSEVDIDQSLLNVYPSPPPWTGPTSATRDPDDEPELHPPSGPSLRKAMSHGESPSSAPAPSRPSLRRAKTTSTRLDTLQDVYSAVANGASQIPLSELVQATRLVHQIGAALTEQMGKKMGHNPG